MAHRRSPPQKAGEGPGFGLSLKGAVLLQIEQVPSALSELKCLKLWGRFAPPFLYNLQNSLTLAHFSSLITLGTFKDLWQSQLTLTWPRGPGFSGRNKQ